VNNKFKINLNASTVLSFTNTARLVLIHINGSSSWRCVLIIAQVH